MWHTFSFLFLDLDVILGNVALGGGVQVVVQFRVAPLAVDEEHAAGLHVPNDGEALCDVPIDFMLKNFSIKISYSPI